MDGTSTRSRWSPEGWRLWASLAVASVLAAWVPIVISLAVPMYAFDYWGVGSGYLGFGWLAPAVLTGLAVSRFARRRRNSAADDHPWRLGLAIGPRSALRHVRALAAYVLGHRAGSPAASGPGPCRRLREKL